VRLRLAFELLGFVVLAGLIALVPQVVDGFTAYEFGIAGTFFITLLGLAILTGSSGQISLGQGAFMTIGGYTTAILTVDGVYGHHIRDLWTIPIAGVVAGLAGLLVGIPALRLSGLYLALITFGIAVSVPQVPKKFDKFLGGTTGKVLSLVTPPFGLHTTADNWVYYLTWGIAFVLLVAAWLLLRGRTGRALRAIRDSEIAAASSGVNLALYKTLAFGISAFYAGVAGSLYVIAHGYMNPDVFSIVLSVYLVAALAIGGADSLPGLLIGAGVLYVLDYRADDVTRWVDRLPAVHLNPQRAGMSSVIFGAALILVMIALPRGAGGLLRRVFGPLTSRLYSRS
jgi:branched-chain amino acid transport system permease protein